jgi:hypothetical protein
MNASQDFQDLDDSYVMESKMPNLKETDVVDVYLVKVYRRAYDSEESLVGTVEEISGTKKGTFKTEEELLRCLGKQ